MYLTKLASIQMVNWNILERYNQDPLEVFARVQLDPELLRQGSARYPLSKIADLWTEMARVIPDPCFGLTAAECWHPSNFGTLGYALLMSMSVRDTLERLIRFHRIISDARFGTLHEDKLAGTLTFELTNLDEANYCRGREDAALAWILSVLRVNYQRPLELVSASLTHSRPACVGKYYEFFRSPVNFDCDRCGLVVSLEIADKILPSGSKDLADFSDQKMTHYLLRRDTGSLESKVKSLIVEHLPSGTATIDLIASELYVSTRKLQRQLRDNGTSFIALLNETRMEIAQQYVKDKEMDLTEIAFLLGFSEQSTFSRSFKRWTGVSPTKFRKAV